MRFSRAQAVSLTGCLLLAGSGLTVAGGMAASASTPAAAVTRSAASHVLISCLDKGLVRPRRYVIACADGNDYLTGLDWASWRAAAFASGTERINDCIPSCAAGEFHSYPVLAALWRSVPGAHGMGQRYSRLTLIYTGKRPPGSPGARTLGLPG